MMRKAEVRRERSVWSRVRRRIARPLGWILAAAGVVVLMALAVVEWFRTGSLTLEWLAMTSLAVGLALVAVSIGWEQFSDWRESPYRDVDR